MCRGTILAAMSAFVMAILSGQGVAIAQEKQPQGGQGQAGATQYQYVNPMGSSLHWLTYPQVKKELELVPEQAEKIESLRKGTMEKISEIGKIWNTEEPADRRKKYNEAATKLAEETEKQVAEILLPHQQKRLSQVVLQMKLRTAGYGMSGALSADDLTTALGLSDEQRKQLKVTEEEVRLEMQKKTAEFYKQLQEESREKILEVLSVAQRRKLEEMLGENFEWQTWQPAVPKPATPEKKPEEKNAAEKNAAEKNPEEKKPEGN